MADTPKDFRADRFPELSPELIRRLDVPAPRYTSYPTAPEWSPFGHEDYEQALARAGADRGPLSLYVHIPFCRELCTYCGCNVIISRDPARADAYLDTLRREIDLVADRLPSRRAVTRLHLGGGTPTFLSEEQLARLYADLARRFDLLPDAELAIEVDPVVTTRGQLDLLRSLGWNRISMGVQDFDPRVQAEVNRRQSVEETEALRDHARSIGFESVSFDLIYGLPHQTPASWRRTVDEVIRIRPDRISLFSFAYVPSVKPHQKRLPLAAMPRGEDKLALFRAAHDAFVDAGYRAIGMDHFALPDDDLSRAQEEGRLWRDFQGYTTLRAADTVAFGITGIGQVGGAWAQNAKTPSVWRRALEAGRFPVERGHVLTDDDRRRRDVITSLMCQFRCDLGPDGPRTFAAELERLRPLEEEGLVRVRGAAVEVTPLGRVFVRNVASVFDAYLARRGEGDRPVFSRAV